MKKIVISTSSSGLDNFNIPHNIRQIRLKLFINNVGFVDGKNINLSTLEDLMTQSYSSAVKTSPPDKSEVIALIDEVIAEGYEEIFITTLSSEMSESYKIISQIAESYKHKVDIHVYDCKDLNICESILALEAEYLLQNGATFEEICHSLDNIRKNHQMLFAVNDIDYLIKNKRLSNTSGFFANLLDIKPVLEVTNDGKIVPKNKIRNIDRTFDYIINDYEKLINEHPNSYLYVLSGMDKKLTKEFMVKLEKSLGITEIPILPTSTIAVANHGPSVVGLCIFKDVIPHSTKYFSDPDVVIRH